MLLAGDSPLTSKVTELAYPDRYTAACPAEFPAPTTNTSLSWPGLGDRCPVVHPCAGKPSRTPGTSSVCRDTPVAMRIAWQLISEPSVRVRAIRVPNPYALRLQGREYLRAKLACLGHGPSRQIPSAQAGRKPR